MPTQLKVRVSLAWWFLPTVRLTLFCLWPLAAMAAMCGGTFEVSEDHPWFRFLVRHAVVVR